MAMPQLEVSHPVISTPDVTSLMQLPVKCPQCTMTFSKESGLKRHMKVHRDRVFAHSAPAKAQIISTSHFAPTPILCHICHMQFIQPNDLRDHIHTQHYWNTNMAAPNIDKCTECACFRPVTPLCTIHPFRCEPCSYQFQTGRAVASIDPHSITPPPDVETKPLSVGAQNSRCQQPNIKESTHSGTVILANYPSASNEQNTKPHCCPDCPKAFSHASTLSMHRKIHTGDFKYVCNYCDKPFVLQEYYIRHLRVHTKEKPYACDICEKCFSQSNTLTQHRRTHTGEKPFACDQCGKQFSVRDYLNKHMRVHTGEKPYGCPVCEKKYSQPSTLRSHQIRNSHTLHSSDMRNLADTSVSSILASP